MAPQWGGTEYGVLPPHPEQPDQFKCFQCGNVYRWKGNLVAHLRVECGKDPQQQCPHCPQRFKHKSHLKRHVLRLHPGHRWQNE